VNSQHLSDEALAAFADGVLSGHARDRATRHAAGCPECAHEFEIDLTRAAGGGAERRWDADGRH